MSSTISIDDINKEKQDIIIKIMELLESAEPTTICVSGSAGTGKSLLISMIANVMARVHQYGIYLAPTNKAAKVLRDLFSSENVATIHSALGLRPSLDITKYDATSMEFAPIGKSIVFENFDFIVVDECSMVNDDLYQSLVAKAMAAKSSIIFIGDPLQLAPVDQSEKSMAFSCKHKFALKQVFRQKNGSPAIKYIDASKKKFIYNFKPQSNNNGEIKVYDDLRLMLHENIHKYMTMIDNLYNNGSFKWLDYVKTLAYTNKRVNELNAVIRNSIFDPNKPFCKGDILMRYGSNRISDSDYMIVMDYNGIKSVDWNGINLDFHVLTVKFDINPNLHEYKILRANNVELESALQYLNMLKEKALSAKDKMVKRKRWIEFFYCRDSLNTMNDLYLNGELLVAKNIDYGYCMTVHKSQGSTYDNVIIDMENISSCFDKEQKRQLQYVALSRTSSNIYILT